MPLLPVVLLIASAAPVPDSLDAQIKEVADWVDAMKSLTRRVEARELEAKKVGKNRLQRLEIDLEPQKASGTGPAKANWEVECAVDDLTDLRSCWLRTRDLEAQLSIFYLGQSGPFILPGVPDAPGKFVTVRVDRNEAVTFAPGTKEPARQAALAEQLRAGGVVRFEYVRTHGAERGAIELAGLKEAYVELLRQRGLSGHTSWKQGSHLDTATPDTIAPAKRDEPAKKPLKAP